MFAMHCGAETACSRNSALCPNPSIPERLSDVLDVMGTIKRKMSVTVASIVVNDSTVKGHNPRPSSGEGDVRHESAGVCALEPSGI